MHIDIHVPRPGMLILALVALSGWAVVLWGGNGTSEAPVRVQASVTTTQEQAVEDPAREVPADSAMEKEGHAVVTDHFPSSFSSVAPTGGDDTLPAVQYTEAEQKALRLRQEQEVLRNKQEILREQLTRLQEERLALGAEIDPALEQEFRQSTQLLVSLIQDERRAEQFLKTSLNQMREAESRAVALTVDKKTSSITSLLWPVQPLLGISAYFKDAAYAQRFHMEHHAIDIPINQGSEVYAAAGGIVAEVADHGLGFSYVTIEHAGGYSTLYGHLTEFAVAKGQRIVAGDVIGLSGGRPGTLGAGMSTGPHVHFAMFKEGKAVDPLEYLPKASGI